MSNEIEIIDNNTTELSTQSNAALADTSLENILYMADKADKYIAAVNRIMDAAVKITSEYDWTLIQGKPYLQESGASKVATLFGINVETREEPTREVDSEGYVAYTYKLRLSMNGRFVDTDGCRSMKDDFFCRAGGKTKKPDEIDEYDVKKSAYTNAVVRGLKTLVPGLRNIDISVLENAGFDMNKVNGYTFKTASKGGNTKKAEDTGLVCAKCGKAITQRVASYSEGKYGAAYCMDCQKEIGNEQA